MRARAHAAPVNASPPSVDLDAARTAVRRAADDFVRLVASAPDASVRIPGSEWTVGDAAAHVALGTEAYVGYAHGTTEPWVDVSDIAGGSLARSNAGRLDLEPVREPAALAARVRAAAAELLATTEGRIRRRGRDVERPDRLVERHARPRPG